MSILFLGQYDKHFFQYQSSEGTHLFTLRFGTTFKHNLGNFGAVKTHIHLVSFCTDRIPIFLQERNEKIMQYKIPLKQNFLRAVD